MSDSVRMISEMVAYLDTLPKTAGGDVRVENPTEVAVAFVGIVAPIYQEPMDAMETARLTAESMEAQVTLELTGLRGEVDQLRMAVSTVKAYLENDDIVAAKAALSVV